MPTNKGKRKANLEAERGGRPKRGVSSVASTATGPRRSGRGGAAPLDPAAIAVRTSSTAVTTLWSKGSIVKKINAQDVSAKTLPPQHIMGSGLRKSPPELNAVPVSTEGGAASAVTGPSVNTGQNLDIHDASSFPVPSITAQDNISVYSSSEDDSSVFDISAKKTTSKIKGQSRSLKRQTGGAKTKKSRTAGGAVKRKKRLAAATSLVNLTGVCLETEGNGDNVLPAVDNVLPAIDEAINEMFPPLRESVADDIEVVGLARKETPLFEVEGVAAAHAPFGSSDMFSHVGYFRLSRK